MRIVDDDDTGWKEDPPAEQDKDGDDDDDEEGDLPVVAEFIDERPEGIKLMEAFRTSNKWKLLGDKNEELPSSDISAIAKSTNSSEGPKQNQPSKRRGRGDSSDPSSPRRGHKDLLDSPPKSHRSVSSKNDARNLSRGQEEDFPTERSASRKWQKRAGDSSPPERKAFGSSADTLLSEKHFPLRNLPSKKAHHRKKHQRHDSESSSGSPSWKKSAGASSDSDLSPPRLQNLSPARSPPRRNRSRSSDSDLSPPRRSQEPNKRLSKSAASSSSLRTLDAKGRGNSQQGSLMLSGGQAGLVSAESLRVEQEEIRRQGRSSHKRLEAESRHAETVFRDKAGRKRDLQQERLEQQAKAEEKSARDEQYAQWGKGLAQSRQQQQNVEDAVKEMHKPLARYIDDQDLDTMLREQEREGDPMAGFIRKKKAKEKTGTKEKPRYNGPVPPLNRFDIWPGHRWDGVDRSNGFEQKRFARIASKKAVQEMAYKWSVEDM